MISITSTEEKNRFFSIVRHLFLLNKYMLSCKVVPLIPPFFSKWKNKTFKKKRFWLINGKCGYVIVLKITLFYPWQNIQVVLYVNRRGVCMYVLSEHKSMLLNE